MDHDSTLVTGAAGFAGRHLLAHLRTSPLTGRLVAWSRKPAPSQTNDDVRWQQVDITDRGAVAEAVRESRPRRIVHLAGSPHVGQSWLNAWSPMKTNVIGTHHLIQAVLAHNPKCRLLVVTSGMIYRPSNEPLDEDAPLAPTSPYGLSKLAQDQLALAAARDHNLDVVVARPFNHAGPGQDADFFLASFAKQIAVIEAGLTPPEIHVGNLDAERDLTDVRDVVIAYGRLLDNGTAGRAYNVCSDRAHRVGDLLDRLMALARVPVTRVLDPSRLRPSDVPRVLGNSNRLRTELGWRPRRSIDQTLVDTLDYWRAEVAGGRVTA
jgi:GDP-4-dehydro-6-deoxy-D-mannose reductase